MRDLSNDHALLSINSMTVKPWSLEQLIEGCARAGISAISPWRDIVQACGIDRAAKLISAHGMTVTGLCRGGMFPAADDAGRRAALDDNRRAVDEAAAIGAQCLILVVGGLPKGSRDIGDARRQVRDALAALLPHARQANMPLAIEPLHPMFAADRACVNTLAHANDLCDELGEGVGVAIDTYHVWWDPDLFTQIARAGASGRILAHHICDWLVPTRHMLLDRGMMGDGVIEFRPIRRAIEAAGYQGPQAVEILSELNWWTRPGDEVLRTAVERYDALCRVE
jgi:sugar phosphate isomerase/epimerase